MIMFLIKTDGSWIYITSTEVPAEEEPAGTVTADRTDLTADNTTITADQT